jgi:dUTP pyrophosphatase
MTLDISIRRLRPDVELPRYQSDGAAGFDLAASDDVVVQPGQVVLVPTGLVIQAPPGHFLAIVARSSTPMKRGLMVANGVGIVDEDYCGPADQVKIEVINFTQQPVTVARGDRLAQGLFLPVVRAEWRETDGDLREGSRGGFGATG